MLLVTLFPPAIPHGTSMAQLMDATDQELPWGPVDGRITLLLLRDVGVVGIAERMPVRSRSISAPRARTRLGLSVSAAPALAEPLRLTRRFLAPFKGALAPSIARA